MHRFFCSADDISQSEAVLRGAEAHHLAKVLRLRPGDEVELYDGSDTVYRAEIAGLGTLVQLSILSRTVVPPPRPAIRVGQGLLKGKKMDLIVQKACELGMAGLAPFYSSFGTVRTTRDNRIERWEKIALEACKQCGRPVPPTIVTPCDFKELLESAEGFSQRLLFWEKEEERTLHDLAPLAGLRDLFFLIGPEGGFSMEEIERAREAGFITLSLGRRTLRAETAALAAMAVLQHLTGNL